jgi:hypothetical protein
MEIVRLSIVLGGRSWSALGKFVVILAILCVIISYSISVQYAEGADWKIVTSSEDRTTVYYIDSDSISYEPPGIVRIWGKTVYQKGSDQYGKYKYLLCVWEIDCSERRFRVPEIVPYDNSDHIVPLAPALWNQLLSLRSNPQSGWKNITLGSAVEAIAKKICK